MIRSSAAAQYSFAWLLSVSTSGVHSDSIGGGINQLGERKRERHAFAISSVRGWGMLPEKTCIKNFGYKCNLLSNVATLSGNTVVYIIVIVLFLSYFINLSRFTVRRFKQSF